MRPGPLISPAGASGASKLQASGIEGEHETNSPYFPGALIWEEEMDNEQVGGGGRSFHIMVSALEKKIQSDEIDVVDRAVSL